MKLNGTFEHVSVVRVVRYGGVGTGDTENVAQFG
jgi:hypothetical protein